MTAPDLRVGDPRVRAAEAVASELARAHVRYAKERKSNCASPEDIAFWQSEVVRLTAKYDEVWS